QVILITGASGGIGRACAIALSEAYPKCVLVLSGRRADALRETADACTGPTEIAVGDVSKDEDVASMFEMVTKKYGRLDVLFNNAGVDLLPSTPLEDADMATFRRALDINIMGAVLCTAAAIRLMRTHGGGRIVNNGSIASSAPRPNAAAYTVSKHAVLGLSRSTSLDGRKFGITCTQLDIGNAATDMISHAARGATQADGSVRPEPMMRVENVAKTLVFLAGLGADADVMRMEILAAGMPFIGRG
ncbi:NAD(P)-binding protein, partial [Cutaneotrichosporon oleaginosum]